MRPTELVGCAHRSAVTATTGLVTLVPAIFAVVIGKDAVVTGCIKVAMAAAVWLCSGPPLVPSKRVGHADRWN